MTREVFTIGHSTHTLEDFAAILKAQEVKQLLDVRCVPRSRHNPQFNKETLPGELRKAGIGYAHLPGLGGLRHARKDSVNTGWRNASFRGFADYMQTEGFEKNIERLIKLSQKKKVCLMCAEAVPWRCHRSLIADALQARGVKTMHIFSATNVKAHELTTFAKKRGTRLTYPG